MRVSYIKLSVKKMMAAFDYKNVKSECHAGLGYLPDQHGLGISSPCGPWNLDSTPSPETAGFSFKYSLLLYCNLDEIHTF